MIETYAAIRLDYLRWEFSGSVYLVKYGMCQEKGLWCCKEHHDCGIIQIHDQLIALPANSMNGVGYAGRSQLIWDRH